MVELRDDSLLFSFPDVHPDAVLSVSFQRTLRIPDDGRDYPLPPSLGAFPLRHVDDCEERVPESWIQYGGVMLPMYQSEALWLSFHTPQGYPFAVKVATGKQSAITGDAWREGLHRSPEQDYLVCPEQPWLDGYVVERGMIRQFVAMPLGSGYSAEEQLTGQAEHGGLQLQVYPLKRKAWERVLAERARQQAEQRYWAVDPTDLPPLSMCADMGLAPGGQMRQEIYEDPYPFGDWDPAHTSRCFVHIANTLVWRSITGEEPPTVPLTAEEYTRAGLPWFELYAADLKPLPGSKRLHSMKSVAQLGEEKQQAPLPENQSVEVKNIKVLRKGLGKHQVREGSF
jgi:hypothetical protein